MCPKKGAAPVRPKRRRPHGWRPARPGSRLQMPVGQNVRLAVRSSRVNSINPFDGQPVTNQIAEFSQSKSLRASHIVLRRQRGCKVCSVINKYRRLDEFRSDTFLLENASVFFFVHAFRKSELQNLQETPEQFPCHHVRGRSPSTTRERFSDRARECATIILVSILSRNCGTVCRTVQHFVVEMSEVRF